MVCVCVYFSLYLLPSLNMDAQCNQCFRSCVNCHWHLPTFFHFALSKFMHVNPFSLHVSLPRRHRHRHKHSKVFLTFQYVFQLMAMVIDTAQCSTPLRIEFHRVELVNYSVRSLCSMACRIHLYSEYANILNMSDGYWYPTIFSIPMSCGRRQTAKHSHTQIMVFHFRIDRSVLSPHFSNIIRYFLCLWFLNFFDKIKINFPIHQFIFIRTLNGSMAKIVSIAMTHWRHICEPTKDGTIPIA